MNRPDFNRDPIHNYLLTKTLQTRYVIAAHHVRECRHIVEVGGSQTPITNFITSTPESVTVIDPLVTPYQNDSLDDHPCRIIHAATKIQDFPLDHEPFSYGLVMLGFSLEMEKQAKDDVWQLMIELVNNAAVTILEYPPTYKPSARQVKFLLDRANVNEEMIANLDFRQDKGAIQHNPTMSKQYLYRRLMVLTPKPRISITMKVSPNGISAV